MAKNIIPVVLKTFDEGFPLSMFDIFILRSASRMRPAENADGGMDAMMVSWHAETVKQRN